MPARASKRAQDFFAGLQEEFDWINPGESVLSFDTSGGAVWWTFAGKLVNATLARMLSDVAGKVTFDNYSVGFAKGVTADAVARAVRKRVLDSEEPLSIPLDEDFIASLKFAECLPVALLELELKARYSVEQVLGALIEQRLAMVWDSSVGLK